LLLQNNLDQAHLATLQSAIESEIIEYQQLYGVNGEMLFTLFGNEFNVTR
jgi:hypothetical protein